MGGDSDDKTDIVSNTDTVGVRVAKPIKAGYYRGDFEKLAPGTDYEPEIILDADGSFRYIIAQNNEAVYMLGGSWLSRNDSMFHDRYLQSGLNFGFFEFWDTLTSDTAQVRNVTDTSFERQEYVPIANQGFGKIAWVSYRLIQYPKLSQGRFELEGTFNDTPYTVSFELGAENAFAFEQTFNEQKVSRNTADWWQLGSFLFTRRQVFYGPDSNQVLVVTDSLDAEAAYRIKDISSSAFKVWNGSEWDEFKRVE
jgi:hypothetical protein